MPILLFLLHTPFWIFHIIFATIGNSNSEIPKQVRSIANENY
jgi:hypothetical protein